MCEDIAQEVFFTAYKKLSSFDSARSKFSTWLFTIARNKSINALKKKKLFLMSAPPENSDSSTPADNLANKEFYNQLDKVLLNLPRKQKTAFVMAELEKLSYEEIAQIEGKKLGTIKSRINRAKKKLRLALKNFKEDNV